MNGNLMSVLHFGLEIKVELVIKNETTPQWEFNLFRSTCMITDRIIPHEVTLPIIHN